MEKNKMIKVKDFIKVLQKNCNGDEHLFVSVDMGPGDRIFAELEGDFDFTIDTKEGDMQCVLFAAFESKNYE